MSAGGWVSSPSLSPATGVSVTPVESRRGLREFIHLPWRLYQDNPHWIAPLFITENERFDPKRNAFYHHSQVQLFVARRNGRVVGRISAHIDGEHVRYWNEKIGFFGFLECDNDPAIAQALLSTAEAWLRERGMERIRGPLSFSTNGEVGFLMWNFDEPQLPLMPYTHPYYLELMEGAGYAKVKDLYAWKWDGGPMPDGPGRRMVEELRARPDLKVRRARIKDFRKEYETILRLYNDAWSANWGFVPATEAEADEIAKSLKLIVDPAIVPIVEVNGVPAAIALAIPNYYWALQPLRGRLFPFGWLRFLWRLKVRRPRSGRLLLFGVGKEFRSRQYAGLTYLLCDEIYLAVRERGYEWAEFGWTLEDNGLINSFIKKIGARHYKSYRVYEKVL
ncbi:MAG: GNAT family N-acetyltransferase [Chloroflexota bacterium]